MDERASTRPSTWPLVLAACAILMITMGGWQSLGLFVLPLNLSLGVSIASISFAMAIGQFVWGAAQPIFGAVADRWGAGRVLVSGAVLLALGNVLTSLASTEWELVLALGVVLAAGAGAGSFAVLMGAAAERLPPERRAFASGFINAGGSFGQFLFAPLNRWMIDSYGWGRALWLLAAAALLTAPLSLWLRSSSRRAPGSPSAQARGLEPASAEVAPADIGLRAQLRQALRDRSYWCLHAGFFTCGFHVAFLVTHLPNEVTLCGLDASVASTSLAIIGLSNIFGSLAAGYLGSRFPMKWILFWIYFTRVFAVLSYIAAPKAPSTFYVFAAVLGETWLATVPPTAGLTAKLFGTRYLATLFGLTLLSHQVGGFFGAWLGGIAVTWSGSYGWMWWADAALALAAAFVNLPIREARIRSLALA